MAVNESCAAQEGATFSGDKDKSTIQLSMDAITKAQAIQCEDLPVGQSRIVSVDADKSPTSLAARYRITHASKNDYEVEVNINFIDKNGNHTPAVSDEFRQHANYCYQRADQALLGPNGEHLHIKMIQDGDPGPLPPAHNIKQAPDDSRGDEENFNLRTFSCPIFLHESLHMLGLVDEYHEGAIGIVPDKTGVQPFLYTKSSPDKDHTAFDCRSIGDPDSVMVDQAKAWGKSFGINSETTVQVTCECRSPTCHFTKIIPGIESCPNGSEGVSANQFLAGYSAGMVIGLKPIDDKHALFTSNPTHFSGESLLKPAHFNSIVHPGCTVNIPYYSCARNAYRSSTAHGGTGCVETPSYCNSKTATWTKGLSN